VEDLPLTIHRDSPRPTDKRERVVAARSLAVHESQEQVRHPERRHNSMTSAATSLFARAHARVQQLARLMTSHGQQVCTTLLPRRRTAIRRQDNGRHPTLRPNKPLQYAQPAHQPVHRQPPGSGVHPCTAPCTRRCRPTRQCESLTGFNLPSVAHRPVHTVRQRPVHSQRQLATAVQPIPAGTRAAACTTVAQVCHIFSSPPASAAANIWCASLHSALRTAVRVQLAAWISNGFQLAIRLAAVHAHGSAATRTLNDQPWPAAVHTIAADSPHRNAPSGQQSVTRCASIQTTAVRTTRAPLGAPACVTLGRVQSRNCRNIEPDQAHIKPPRAR